MDKFDLEQKINQTYHFSDKIDDVVWGIQENNMSKDDIVNALNGISLLLNLHIERMFDTFCEVHKLDGYRNK